MLKRLQDSKSIYDVEEWQKDRLKKIQIVGRIAKYDCVLLNAKDFKAVPGGFKPQHNNNQSTTKLQQMGPGSKDLLLKLPKVKTNVLSS